MNAITETAEARADKLEGIGCKRKRVEDVRFTRGKGNYVDDLNLPGMLYGDLVRSPYAHARVKNIDTTKAAAVPGVVEHTFEQSRHDLFRPERTRYPRLVAAFADAHD